MTLSEFRDQAYRITSDMKDFIRYVPDRDADLRQFMKNYLDSEPEDRQPILEQLRHCINGEPYDEPDYGRDYYTTETVDKVDAALEKYYRDVLNANGDTEQIGKAIEDVTNMLNKLDALSERGLIDTYRRELLCELIDNTAAEFGYVNPQQDLDEFRMW